jgi:prenylcysteine oxidase/farnesylcysteine lyase
MATNGAMQIEGGNWQIFASMLNASMADLHLNTTVSKISKQEDKTYQLTTVDDYNATFDEVILAAPLQYTDLIIDPAPKHTPDAIPYTKLYTTLFASPHRLDPVAFNLAPGTSVPQYVLTTLPPSETPEDNSAGTPGFFSISIHAQFPNLAASPPRLENIYKIFSPAPVNSSFLSNILGHRVTDHEAEHGDKNGTVSWIKHKLWMSYPREYPRVTFEEISLDEGLWYTSGIEGFVSTMETSALSGRNVARLVRDRWAEKQEAAEENEGEEGWLKVPKMPFGDEGGDEAWLEEL